MIGITASRWSRDSRELVRSRVGALLRGDWAELLADARASGQKLARRKGRSSETSHDEASLADEVLRKALSEEYSRAAAFCTRA